MKEYPEAFLKQFEEDPSNWLARIIYRDWLLENGYKQEAHQQYEISYSIRERLVTQTNPPPVTIPKRAPNPNGMTWEGIFGLSSLFGIFCLCILALLELLRLAFGGEINRNTFIALCILLPVHGIILIICIIIGVRRTP